MAIRLPTRNHKYGAKQETVDGINFHSRAEARYYRELKLLQHTGIVKEIQLQPKFIILDPYPNPVTGRQERATYYIADFLVTYSDGKTEVIDVKGVRTETYRLKKKMFESKYQIPIREVS